MSELNYTDRSYDSNNLIAAATSNVFQLDGALELDAVDIDAGREDPALTAYIAEKRQELERQKESLGLQSVPDKIYKNAVIFSESGACEYGSTAHALVDTLSEQEAQEILPLLSDIMYMDTMVGELFPGDFGFKPEQAFGEAVTKLLPAILAIKRGDTLPKTLPLNGGDRSVPVGSYNLGEVVDTLGAFKAGLGRMWRLKSYMGYSFMGVTASRVYAADNFGMYRLMDSGKPTEQALVAIRLKAGKAYDPRIEYGNKDGTQQSIGFTVDMGKDYVSPLKAEQVDPLCIRLDNEGDKIALDIGSILGKRGTLGKKIADLIALGDYVHAKERGEALKLNHSDRPFVASNLHNQETFGRAVAATTEVLERSATRDLPGLYARVEKLVS